MQFEQKQLPVFEHKDTVIIFAKPQTKSNLYIEIISITSVMFARF